jgi:phosphonate transport system permease protein
MAIMTHIGIRPKAILFALACSLLIFASFISLNLQFTAFLSPGTLQKMWLFISELTHPNWSNAYWLKLLPAALETLAMSALGTLIAFVLGIAIAIPASKQSAEQFNPIRSSARWILSFLRSVPELMWAALLLISAGLGPMSGTLALALHTTGVLGRMFAEALENAPKENEFALSVRGISRSKIFFFVQIPQIAPQLMSYTLYRWENNIRAATVLGIVGAGGLGQMLSYYLSLFKMPETSSILLLMIGLVLLVDMLSAKIRRMLA